jgi:hypothetical protein
LSELLDGFFPPGNPAVTIKNLVITAKFRHLPRRYFAASLNYLPSAMFAVAQKIPQTTDYKRKVFEATFVTVRAAFYRR